MPGPITLVLKKNKGLPEYVTNGKDTIAIRMANIRNNKKINSRIRKSNIYDKCQSKWRTHFVPV